MAPSPRHVVLRRAAAAVVMVGVVALLALGAAAGSRGLDAAADGPCLDDPYEYDSWCDAYDTKSRLELGQTRSHLHCDPDWFNLRELEGATYVVETSNLTVGADTVLELWVGDSHCSQLLMADDDGGGGRASRLEWTFGGLGPWDNYFVRAAEAGEAYGEGKGYDISLRCADRCRTWFVPRVAHLAGPDGEATVSDLEVYNPSAEPLDVDLHFAPTGPQAAGSRHHASLRILPGETVEVADLVPALFGVEGSGSLEVDGHDRELVVSSRTRTADIGFTHGQAVPALRRDRALRAGWEFYDRDLFPVVGNATFRTALDLSETTGSPATVRLELHRPDGPVLRTVQLGGFEHRRVDDVVALFDLGEVDPARLRVEVRDGSGRVFAALSSVDRRTGDETCQAVQEEPLRSVTRVIPAAAAADGVNGSRWRTDLWLARTHTSDVVRPRVAFLRAGGATPPRFVTFTVDSPEILVLEDVVTTLGESGTGALLIEDTGGLEVRSRTYHVDDRGTWGQHVPAFQITDAVGAGEGPLVAVGLSGAADVRSNVGFVNPTPVAGRVEVRLYSASGERLGAREYPARPFEHRQLNTVFRALGVEPRPGCRVEVEVIGGRARLLAYVSVVDGTSNDGVFVPARPLRRQPAPVVLDNRLNAVLVDQLPESAGFEALPPGEFTADVSGTGDLGRPDLPIHVVCLYRDGGSETLRAASLTFGQTVGRVAGSYPFRCFIPDWRDRNDNHGSARVRLRGGGETLTLELDARDNCVLIDQLPGAVTEGRPGWYYSVGTSGDLGAPGLYPQVLALYHHLGTGRLVAEACSYGQEVRDVYAGSPLVAVVLDWMRSDDNTGQTVLVPIAWRDPG